MRIGIIGATGMLGHHAAIAAQAAGHEVVVLHRASSRLDNLAGLKYTARVADLDLPTSLLPALRQLDGIINAAAYYPTVPKPWRAEVAHALAQMNHFYDACAQAQVPRIVYLGGSIALTRHPKQLPGDETLVSPREPDDKTPYVQVKWALDRLAYERAMQGLPIVIGIPTMSFGEHDHGPTTGRFIVEIARRAMPAYVPGKRNAVYAGDAGHGLIACLERGRVGERYLLTGENIEMADLVARIATIAGVPAPRAVPLAVARAAAALQEVRYHLMGGAPPKLSATGIAVMASGQFLDGAKAARELDYRPRVSLDDAIGRALAWFRANGYVN